MNQALFDREPVLAVCGWSGSGKTTVLERVIPIFVDRGLRVAVVKHDGHGINIDKEGKDSARFFAAGADIHLRGPSEQVWRSHNRIEDTLERSISRLLCTHDLILIEGHKDTPLPKIWCHSEGGEAVPEGVSGVITTLPWDGDRVPALLSIAEGRLNAACADRVLFGGVLIGGDSRRMGSPKQNLSVGGRSLLSTVTSIFRSKVERVVVLGRGHTPEDAGRLPQISDAPGTGQGPLAGLLTAFRWAPRVCWVVGACDMPGITAEALVWLIDQRRPGCWAVIPRDSEGQIHPTLALYEPQAASLIDTLVDQGHKAPRGLVRWSEIHTPTIPDSLAHAWLNVNSPEDLAAFCKRPN
ncbi:MAG: molybdopterin-guanine dinucleotide biosynthesis protein B [Acidobacteria bacterium]|nr:MAG: molybdopterin-guanine dinucleotide biosynthesis protein B [Acidobacteriota bacterium]